MPIDVTDVPERERFEARDGDADQALAGFMTYQVTGRIIAVTHLNISPGYEDRDVGDLLARAVMDDARSRTRTVVPICPFLAEWATRHREYTNLVAPSTKKMK
ncbi:GNAT family N-acetyltransferase [Micromonospora sp. NPDC049679]|uniref:GNAT family N-acetyltransferase n=1 Tax=Micromonospora sp. NPDC049679 TaxID=3155920 RepID=UPI0033CD8C02